MKFIFYISYSQVCCSKACFLSIFICIATYIRILCKFSSRCPTKNRFALPRLYIPTHHQALIIHVVTPKASDCGWPFIHKIFRDLISIIMISSLQTYVTANIINLKNKMLLQVANIKGYFKQTKGCHSMIDMNVFIQQLHSTIRYFLVSH